MDITLKEVLRQIEPALISLTIFYVFALYPLAIYFWSQSKYHAVYYSFIAAIGFISSWLLHNVLTDFVKERRAMLTEIMALFNMLNLVICLIFIVFPLKFYYGSSKWFLGIFKSVEGFIYHGPDVLRASTIFILVSNIFFFLQVIRNKPKQEEENPEASSDYLPPQ